MTKVHAADEQLVSAVRDLAGKQDACPEAEDGAESKLFLVQSYPDADRAALLDPELTTSDLESALQKRLPTTKKLVNHFVNLTARDGFSPPVAELHSKCSKLQAEVSPLPYNGRAII